MKVAQKVVWIRGRHLLSVCRAGNQLGVEVEELLRTIVECNNLGWADLWHACILLLLNKWC